MFSFDLPPDRIAQSGAEPRDAARMMVVADETEHRRVRDLPDFLRAGDLLVFNESRVIPARLFARKPTGGRVEVLLLRQEEEEGLTWSALLKPARRAGETLVFGDPSSDTLSAEVVGRLEGGARLLRFSEDVWPQLDRLGTLPVPPYIHAEVGERYQTVYARVPGSVAAPTAGLHFTPELLARLDKVGVQRAQIVLHVGAGTFKPVVGDPARHTMHAERYLVSPESADLINGARREGRRVVAVGTTTVRALESAWQAGELRPGAGDTHIFIRPPYRFRVPDLLLTNFHLPNSTLLLLVAAFAGEARVAAAYQDAVRRHYRFYSLGDAMLLYKS